MCSPLTWKILCRSLCTLRFHLLLYFLLHRISQDFIWGFSFNLKIMCLGEKKTICLVSLQSQPLSCLLEMIHSGIQKWFLEDPPLKAKQNQPTWGTLSGLGPKDESTWTCGCPSVQSYASGLKPKPSSHRPR